MTPSLITTESHPNHTTVGKHFGAHIPNAIVPRFCASWGSSYVEPGSKEVGLDFFTQDLGYTEEDRHAISSLFVGQGITLDAGDHEVKRII